VVCCVTRIFLAIGEMTKADVLGIEAEEPDSDDEEMDDQGLMSTSHGGALGSGGSMKGLSRCGSMASRNGGLVASIARSARSGATGRSHR
jgi:hypothetical protein